MPKYIKKPIAIEASQWHKHGDHPAVTYLPAEHAINMHCHQPDYYGWIETLEGGHVVTPGDWVITGVRGENYPCKPDIFASTYDPA